MTYALHSKPASRRGNSLAALGDFIAAPRARIPQDRVLRLRGEAVPPRCAQPRAPRLHNAPQKRSTTHVRRLPAIDDVAFLEMMCLADEVGADPTWDELRQAKVILDTRGGEAAARISRALHPIAGARLRTMLERERDRRRS